MYDSNETCPYAENVIRLQTKQQKQKIQEVN